MLSSDFVIVLLTRDVLLELHTLVAVWFAIKHGMPVISVLLARGGYDFELGCGCMPSPMRNLMRYGAW